MGGGGVIETEAGTGCVRSTWRDGAARVRRARARPARPYARARAPLGACARADDGDDDRPWGRRALAGFDACHRIDLEPKDSGGWLRSRRRIASM